MSGFGAVMRAMALVGIFLAGVTSRACASDEAFPVRLELGESIALCSTGAILCPAGAVRCDDLAIVSIGGDQRGPILTGARVGTTLCSAGTGSGAGMRRVFRVTVVPKRAR